MGVMKNFYHLVDPELVEAFNASADGPRIYRSSSSGRTYFYYCYYYPLTDGTSLVI